MWVSLSIRWGPPNADNDRAEASGPESKRIHPRQEKVMEVY